MIEKRHGCVILTTDSIPVLVVLLNINTNKCILKERGVST